MGRQLLLSFDAVVDDFGFVVSARVSGLSVLVRFFSLRTCALQVGEATFVEASIAARAVASCAVDNLLFGEVKFFAGSDFPGCLHGADCRERPAGSTAALVLDPLHRLQLRLPVEVAQVACEGLGSNLGGVFVFITPLSSKQGFFLLDGPVRHDVVGKGVRGVGHVVFVDNEVGLSEKVPSCSVLFFSQVMLVIFNDILSELFVNRLVLGSGKANKSENRTKLHFII